MQIPEDVTEYLTSEKLTETAISLSKVWSDTPIIQTFSRIPLVSVLTGFHFRNVNVYL